MAQFIGAVSEDARSAARIVGVSGEPGAGKSRFVEEALARMVRAGHPVSLVAPDLIPGMDGQAFLRALMVKLPIGGSMLSGAINRFSQGGLSTRLDESSARALLNALFHETYDSGVERRGFIRPKFQKMVLVLDDFELLGADIAAWLANEFLPRLDEVKAHLDYLLILVGERSLSTVLEPVAWAAQPMRFLSVEIPPMSEAESVELLALYARRADEAKTCHAIGEGLPGAMIELLRHRLLPLKELGASIEHMASPSAEALLAVAGLGFANEEGLKLVLGPDGPASAAGLLAAGAVVPVFGSLRNGGLCLPGAVARMVEERLSRRFSEVARKAGSVGELLDALALHFPSEEERVSAAKLCVFRHFNRAALQGCFGAHEGEALERFAQMHGSAFESTEAENLRFADGVRPLVADYAHAVAEPTRAGYLEKATRLWADRAQELETERKAASGALARLEKERDALFKELEEARGHVVQREKDKQRAWRSRVDQDVVRLGASLLSNVAGVAFLWAAMFSNEQRLTFALCGAILIGIGIGTPALTRQRRVARIDFAEQQRRGQEARVVEAKGMVNLLEARISAHQQRLVEERRKVERLAAAIDEPYV